jgi:hypothetical protein
MDQIFETRQDYMPSSTKFESKSDLVAYELLNLGPDLQKALISVVSLRGARTSQATHNTSVIPYKNFYDVSFKTGLLGAIKQFYQNNPYDTAVKAKPVHQEQNIISDKPFEAKQAR